MIGMIVEFLLILIAHAAVGIYSFTLKYSKRTTCIIWGTWVALQVGLLFYTEFVLTKWALQFFVGFVLSLVGQYVIFFLTTKGKNVQRIFTILTYSIFFCITMTLFTMVKGSLGELHGALIPVIEAIMLFGIVGYFLRYVCPFCRSAAKNITTGWAPLIFVNVVFLITVILSSVFPVRLKSFTDPAAITFFFTSVSIMSVYPVIFSNINSLSEAALKKEVETQNKFLLAQIEVENAQLATDRQARHDRRHHNLVMLEFVNNNDIENVRNYLEKLVDSENGGCGEVHYCENRTVNTVLSVYERKAKENKIFTEISASASRDINVFPQDLVVVIANLFENAVNAVTKLKDDEKRIEIYIKETVQHLLIKVDNPCRENLTFDETRFGVGISSIIETVKKYEGMYDFTAENGTFSAKISLNLK